jgi:hypothetical protein
MSGVSVTFEIFDEALADFCGLGRLPIAKVIRQ